jgi:uncharacterized surface protein with fasciclin (FAS1) repeats
MRVVTFASVDGWSHKALLTDSNSLAADIVVTAVNGRFNILVAAVKAAGLVDTLKGPGPFTVFAPTDEAFSKLPAGTLENLLKPENKEQLKKILTYHVVAGTIWAKEAVMLHSAMTLAGGELVIEAGHSGVRVNNTHITKSDVAATNGVIHVIDAVLLPE